MSVIKHCPNCGCEIKDDNEFCTECGYDIKNKNPRVLKDKDFFTNLNEKTNFTVIIFSFIVFGIFLFIGSFTWSVFIFIGSIDVMTYSILTLTFSVFFGGIFAGYYGCNDESYVLPNFITYLGSIFAILLSCIGLVFTLLTGILAAISSVFEGSTNTYQPTTSNLTQSTDLSGIFKIILLILLIPVASYFGVYIGYYLKKL